MTTIIDAQVTCGMCGTQSTQHEVASTNRFGSPDLDLRPPEMARSTMAYWLQRCPNCSYLAASLDEVEPEAARIVQSAEYKSALKDDAAPQLARQFRCRALMDEALGGNLAAFRNMLAAAWVADDEGLNNLAKRYRSDAAILIQSDTEIGPENKLQLVDVLRRAGMWDAAKATAMDVLSNGDSNERLHQVARFQLGLIEQADESRYVVRDALNAP